MPFPLIRAALLADIDRFQAMRGGLKPGAEVNYTGQILLVLSIVMIIASLVVIIRLVNKRKRMEVNNPQGLFRELSRVHSLDRSQDRMLREVAATLKLEHPSRLFLEPKLFDRVLEEPRFESWQSGEKREKLLALRNSLFGPEVDLEHAMRTI